MRTGPSERFNKGLTKALGGSPINEITEKSLRKDSPEEETIEKGGFGSGHYGHSGRPPKVGGSKQGGVKVGRGEMPDYASQFKYSGEGKLEDRPGGKGTWVKVQDEKGPEGTFVIHASPGRKRNKMSIGMSGGEMVEIGMKEMHDLRSKLRFVHNANERGATQTAGRTIKKGDSMTIQVGKGKNKRQITIPINQQVVDQFHYGVTLAKHAGDLSTAFPDEDTEMVAKIVKGMQNQKDPFKWLNEERVEFGGKSQPISLGGRCAILKVYATKMSDQSLRRRMRENKRIQSGDDPGYAAYQAQRKKHWDAMKDSVAHKSERYSDTQAMVTDLESMVAAQFILAGGKQPR